MSRIAVSRTQSCCSHGLKWASFRTRHAGKSFQPVRQAGKPVLRARRLFLESLEDRCLLAGDRPYDVGGFDPGLIQAAYYVPPQTNLMKMNGRLSVPSPAPALEIARDFLATHADQLGL